MSTALTTQTAIPTLSKATRAAIASDVSYLAIDTLADGEELRGYIFGIVESDVVDPITKETKRLPCVQMLLEKNDTFEKYQTASTALIGKISTMISNGEIIPADMRYPVAIVYAGMKKGSNGKSFANWRIYSLSNEG